MTDAWNFRDFKTVVFDMIFLMKAIQAKRYGSAADVLDLAYDVPEPSVNGPDDVLIRVLATAITVGDHRNLNGSTARVRAPPAFPFIPCHDVCGIVEQIGSAVNCFKVFLVFMSERLEIVLPAQANLQTMVRSQSTVLSRQSIQPLSLKMLILCPRLVPAAVPNEHL